MRDVVGYEQIFTGSANRSESVSIKHSSGSESVEG